MAGKRWLAVHPSNTTVEGIPDADGLKVTFGFWPPIVDIRIRSRLGTLSVFDKSERPDLVELSTNDLEIYREAAKWSVRGWDVSGDETPPALIEEEIDGRKHKALSHESLDLLYVNRLLFAVGQQAILVNVMSAEGKG